MREKKTLELGEWYNKEEYKNLKRIVEMMTKHDSNERISWDDLAKDDYIKAIIEKYCK